MCGEIDEENRFQADLFQRFLVHARKAPAPRQTPQGGMNAYLDGLLGDVLRRCAADAQELSDAEAYHRMAMQSLVLARLAGFLAGHVALNEDPLRRLIEAAMLGYGEADMPRTDDHHHDHGHGHGHHHGGGHHH